MATGKIYLGGVLLSGGGDTGGSTTLPDVEWITGVEIFSGFMTDGGATYVETSITGFEIFNGFMTDGGATYLEESITT